MRDYRAARAKIGLVPQELTTDAFESVWATMKFSRGLFGKPPNPAHLEKVLRDLSLWDKKDSKIMTLSGGMKRRVMIAKALSHEPQILFLDEPTAGVDVELRRDMWEMVRSLRASGVTIILTTHYIEEAEEMADRIGVINKGEIILVEDKRVLMRKLGRKQLTLHLQTPAAAAFRRSSRTGSSSSPPTATSSSTPSTRRPTAPASPSLLRQLNELGIDFKDLRTERKLARGNLREPGEHPAMNSYAIRAIYTFELARWFRTLVQSIALAGDLDLAVLRRVRRGDRLAHGADRRRQLRRVHRARPDHAVGPDREHFQRVVRHLHAALRRHDLRSAVGADLVHRDRASATSARRRPSRSCSA